MPKKICISLAVWFLGISCLQAPAADRPSTDRPSTDRPSTDRIAAEAERASATAENEAAPAKTAAASASSVDTGARRAAGLAPLADNFRKNEGESAVSLYNQAADFLSKEEKGRAFLLLERACANYIYPPACRALQRAGGPLPLALLIWAGAFVVYAFFTLILIGFLIFSKKGAGFKTRRTAFIVWNVLFFALNKSAASAILRPGGRAVQSCDLQNAPIEGALSKGSLKKGEAFSGLKNYRNEWFKIKTESGQAGWVPKERLYWTKD